MAAEYEKLAQLLEQGGFLDGAQATRENGARLFSLNQIPASLEALDTGNSLLEVGKNISQEELAKLISSTLREYSAQHPVLPVDPTSIGDFLHCQIITSLSPNTLLRHLYPEIDPDPSKGVLYTCRILLIGAINNTRRSFNFDVDDPVSLRKLAQKKPEDIHRINGIGVKQAALLEHMLRGPKN